MIDLVFQKQEQLSAVRIMGHHLVFVSNFVPNQFPKFTTIEGLKLDIGGILKEFPDLKEKENKEEIRKIAIKRFKEKLSKMETEEEVKTYVIKDLKKHGFEYKGEALIKKGFRFKLKKEK